MLATGSYWSQEVPGTWYASKVGWMTCSRPFDGMPLMALMSQLLMARRVAAGLPHDVRWMPS